MVLAWGIHLLQAFFCEIKFYYISTKDSIFTFYTIEVMNKKILFLGLLAFVLSSFSGPEEDRVAYNHIQNLKKGVLLVRLHTQDALIAKMKFYHQDVARKKKIEEIYQNNKSAFAAFSAAYKFSEIRFFFGRDSKKVRENDFSNIFINADLEMDTNITVPENMPVYVLDVGDIFFPNMSGHQEGVVVMNTNMEPLTKPFPYYVRKRSGMAIIKRTDLDLAVILNDKLTAYYNESVNQIGELP